MKTLRNLFLAIATWAMMSVSALATDVIVVSTRSSFTNDPFWSVAKNGVDAACKDMGIFVSTQRQELLTWLKWQN